MISSRRPGCERRAVGLPRASVSIPLLVLVSGVVPLWLRRRPHRSPFLSLPRPALCSSCGLCWRPSVSLRTQGIVLPSAGMFCALLSGPAGLECTSSEMGLYWFSIRAIPPLLKEGVGSMAPSGPVSLCLAPQVGHVCVAVAPSLGGPSLLPTRAHVASVAALGWRPRVCPCSPLVSVSMKHLFPVGLWVS